MATADEAARRADAPEHRVRAALHRHPMVELLRERVTPRGTQRIEVVLRHRALINEWRLARSMCRSAESYQLSGAEMWYLDEPNLRALLELLDAIWVRVQVAK